MNLILLASMLHRSLHFIFFFSTPSQFTHCPCFAGDTPVVHHTVSSYLCISSTTIFLFSPAEALPHEGLPASLPKHPRPCWTWPMISLMPKCWLSLLNPEMFTSLFLQVQVKSEVFGHETKSSRKSLWGETWSSLKTLVTSPGQVSSLKNKLYVSSGCSEPSVICCYLIY